MSILSFDFLFFAAATLIAYYILPLKIRWLVLFAASVVFVALSGWASLAHLTAAALLTWLGGWLLGRAKRGRKPLLALFLTLDLGTMAFMKYQSALVGWINALGDGAQLLPVWEMAMPLGLSYFTFQSAGYLIDVFRGKAQAQRNPLKAWLFVGYFPQLAQGPISTWKELGAQLFSGHRFDETNFISGFQLLLWGYFKKLVIADRLTVTTGVLLEGKSMPGWFVLGGVILYTLRLYADFSGGMDVVRGFSRMLGIELPLNFKRPFFAKTVAEYWRRWHITLGAWFKSYMLYPVSTSRAGLALGRRAEKVLGKKSGRMLPTALATLLIFLLIGIWHTANWNALIYGAYFGVLMSVSMLLDPVWKKMRKGKKQAHPFLRMVRTWLCVLPAQYFAFTNHPAQGLELMRETFLNWQFAQVGEWLTAVTEAREWIIAGIALIVLLIVDLLCERKNDLCDRLARKNFLVRWPILLLLLLVVLIFGVYGTGYDGTAFLYTQF